MQTLMYLYPGLNPESFSSSAQTAKSKYRRSTKNRNVPEIKFNVSRVFYVDLAVYHMKDTLVSKTGGYIARILPQNTSQG